MMEMYMTQCQKAASRRNEKPNYEEAVLQEVKVVKVWFPNSRHSNTYVLMNNIVSYCKLS